jgi:hypothetical protein
MWKRMVRAATVVVAMSVAVLLMSVSSAQAHDFKISSPYHFVELSADHFQVTSCTIRGNYDGWADVRYRSGKFNHFYAPIFPGICAIWGVRGEPQAMRLCENRAGHIWCSPWRQA